MTSNVVGVWESGAENQSKIASKIRTPAAPQTPGPTMKRRSSAVSFSGNTTPYTDMAMTIAENMVRAMVIGAPFSS
jgi:hypothetical protein